MEKKTEIDNKNNKNNDKNELGEKTKHVTRKNLLEKNEVIKGFLLCTDKNREKNSVKDAYNILNDATEKLYPSLYENRCINLNEETNINPNKNNNKNISSQIDAELNEFKKRKIIFNNFNIHCKAIIFIKIESEYEEILSPKSIVTYIMDEVIKSKKSLSKNISKFYPIEICMKYSYEVFTQKVDEMIKKYFNNETEGEKRRTWKLELRTRNNNSINKKELMKYVLSCVDQNKFEVDYKNPELTFLVEISCSLMCLSVLEKFSYYKSYNIQSLAKSEEELMNERNKLMKLQQENTKKYSSEINKDKNNDNNENDIDNKKTLENKIEKNNLEKKDEKEKEKKVDKVNKEENENSNKNIITFSEEEEIDII